MPLSTWGPFSWGSNTTSQTPVVARESSTAGLPKGAATNASEVPEERTQLSGNGNAMGDAPKSSDPTVIPAWKQKIMEKNEANKQEINKIGDDFTDKAIARIMNMPEERRDKAADEYIKSTDYIMSGVMRVMNFSQSVGKYF